VFKGYLSSSSGQENSVIQCYKGVSLFYQPTRHERGSAGQNYNSYKDEKIGKLPFICFKNVLIYNHFEHTLGSIQATGAEIQPVKGLSKNTFLLDISVTVGPSSILSLICDRVVFRVQIFKIISRGQFHERS
jgi:hypothetical protein